MPVRRRGSMTGASAPKWRTISQIPMAKSASGTAMAPQPKRLPSRVLMSCVTSPRMLERLLRKSASEPSKSSTPRMSSLLSSVRPRPPRRGALLAPRRCLRAAPDALAAASARRRRTGRRSADSARCAVPEAGRELPAGPPGSRVRRACRPCKGLRRGRALRPSLRGWRRSRREKRERRPGLSAARAGRWGAWAPPNSPERRPGERGWRSGRPAGRAGRCVGGDGRCAGGRDELAGGRCGGRGGVRAGRLTEGRSGCCGCVGALPAGGCSSGLGAGRPCWR